MSTLAIANPLSAQNQTPTSHPRAFGVKAIVLAALGLFAVFLALGGGTSAFADSSIFNNWNTGGVMNNPSHATVFILRTTTHINTISTYHWNNGRGATPGTISLFEQNSARTYGPFAAQGSSAGTHTNVNWTANINVTLPPGSYVVRDSDPSTWSNNTQTFYAGFANVRGDVVSSKGSAPTTTPPTTLPPIVLPPLTPAALTASCSPGFVPLPAFRPTAPVKFAAWVNPCTFGFVQNTCRFYGLSAVVVRAGYYFVGRTAYTEILAGCA